MAAKIAGVAKLHNVFLAHAHRRLSLTCSRKLQCGAAKSEQVAVSVPAAFGHPCLLADSCKCAAGDIARVLRDRSEGGLSDGL